MKTLLIKNVKHLVTCDTDDRVLNGVNVLVQDGIIVRIGQEDMTADDVIDASHMVMYPGLINTHHHLYQTFSRNLPQVQNMELFPWLKTLYEIWKNVNENVAYYSSLTGMGELLKMAVLPVWITTMYSQRAIIREFWTPSLQPPTPWASVSMPPEEAWI